MKDSPRQIPLLISLTFEQLQIPQYLLSPFASIQATLHRQRHAALESSEILPRWNAVWINSATIHTDQ